jgi:hypothetical protein
MENTEIIKATILVDRNTWNLFKKVCKLNETDASKEIRKFIKAYIADNSDKVAELVKKGQK